MQEYSIDCTEAYNDFLDYLNDNQPVRVELPIIEFSNDRFYVDKSYWSYLQDKLPQNSEDSIDDVIYGKDNTEKLVSIAVKNDRLFLFKEDEIIERPMRYWILTARSIKGSEPLKGNLHFKYIKYYNSKTEYLEDKKLIRLTGTRSYSPFVDEEFAMLLEGTTLFKNTKISEVSILSVDIEAEGLYDIARDKPYDSKPEVYLISNTFRSNTGEMTRKLFALDEYKSSAEMIEAWCEWVREYNPSIICAHNGLGYDFPYLNYVYKKAKKQCLPIGRDGSPIEFEVGRLSKKRKAQGDYCDYRNVEIFGREIVDTLFLVMNADFKKKYISHALKQIEIQEGWVSNDRIVWDFTKNPTRKTYNDPVLWEQFKQYCIDDGDGALKIFDKYIPSYFYYTRSVPKSLQMVNNTASGSQVNSILVRSYLQSGHSIPKGEKKIPFGGAISSGEPGLHKHVLKVDVASLYPSIMLSYKVEDKAKDPKGNFLKMVKYFTEERLVNKQLSKDTGDSYYDSLEQSQKIVINSAYGMLGANNLHFNSMKNAARVTEIGRDILQTGVDWVCGKQYVKLNRLKKNGEPETTKDGIVKTYWKLTDGPVGGKGYSIVNCDTDSFSYTKGREVLEEEFNKDIKEINSLFQEGIVWEDDGRFESVLVLKTKNYVLDRGKYDPEEPLVYKGSSMRDQKREPALIEMIKSMIEDCLLKGKPDDLLPIYHKYILEALDIKDINRWAKKLSVSDKVLKGEATTQTKIRDSFNGRKFTVGDKIWTFNDIDGEVPVIEKGIVKLINGKKCKACKGKECEECNFTGYSVQPVPKMKDNEILRLVEDFGGTYDRWHYVERVWTTINILENVLDIEEFIKYHLKTKRVQVEDICAS